MVTTNSYYLHSVFIVLWRLVSSLCFIYSIYSPNWVRGLCTRGRGVCVSVDSQSFPVCLSVVRTRVCVLVVALGFNDVC